MTAAYDTLLNPSQAEAVYYTGGPLLILAGAGSGKTRVITYKAAYLVEQCGYDPSHILAVTFTNKASGEMKERVDRLLGERTDMWIKTFHAAAARLLRLFGGDLGVAPGFNIIDQQDQVNLLRRLIKELDLDPDTCQPSRYAALINRAKDRLLGPRAVEDAGPDADPYLFPIYSRYQDSLLRANLMDFGDLLMRLTRGLEQNPRVLARLHGWFRYLLVDEFQDTNHAQYRLLRLLAGDGRSVCVVGDDDQSIYAFRGARVENVTEFTSDFKDVRIVRLEQNYRSSQSILTAASRVISNNRGRLGKNLYSNRGKGEKLSFLHTYTDYDEARFIAFEIKELVRRERRAYSDTAVFYRMNAQSRVLESVLTQERIPYAVVGGQRFYEREEIKDVLAYLRLMMNPLDEISLRRVANRPPRRVGEKTVDALVEATVRRGLPYHRLDQVDLPSSRMLHLQRFVSLLQELASHREGYGPLVLLRELYEKSGYLQWLKKERGEERVRNLDELYNAVEEYVKGDPQAGIAEFLEEVSLNQGAGDQELAEGRVHLITLHNAKGLEFPVVFMAGMEEGIFPHHLSGDRIEEVQEERRLCYVGMTRAMERLYLTAARVRKLYGRSIEREVSSFIREIPRELLEYRQAGIPSPKSGTRPTGAPYTAPGRGSGIRERLSDREIDAIRPGDRVRHRQFGLGSVAAVSGGVADITFDDGKKMRFMLKYTPLTRE